MVKYKTIQSGIDKYWDKAHEKNPDNYSMARLIIYAPDDGDLKEMTLTYINTLNYNGAWDFDVESDADSHINTITFKYNRTMTAVSSIQKLKFHCEHKIKWEWL